jgi:hypothetical protein
MRKIYSKAVLGALLSFSSLSFGQEASSENALDKVGETTASIFKIDENTSYADNLSLRDARKIGLGIATGGSLGMYGFNVEVNFEDINSAVAGFGGGSGFSAFHVLWKHTFPGDTIAPYFSTGYSRWYNSSGGRNFERSAVLDRVLSDSQKAERRFAADFLTGSLGLQYTHLAGELAGLSLFAEVVLLDEVNRGMLVPTGAVGAGYYF